MGLGPTHGGESCCHPEPFAVTLSEAKGLQFAPGKLPEGSAVPLHGELMRILRLAHNDGFLTERPKFRTIGVRSVQKL